MRNTWKLRINRQIIFDKAEKLRASTVTFHEFSSTSFSTYLLILPQTPIQFMGQSTSSRKAHPPSPSPSSSQLTNILESIPLEIWLQILQVMDLKTLVFLSSTCMFFRQPYIDNRLGVFYHSHRKPIHISKALTVSTEPGEPQSSQTDALAPPKQQLLFPKVLMVELPWKIPQNLSLNQVSFMIIQGSDEFIRKVEPIGKLFNIFDKNFPMKKHVSMSKVLLDWLDLQRLSKLNIESLYLQSCCINPFETYSLCWGLIKGLKKLHITIESTDQISAFLSKSLREFIFHGCYRADSKEKNFYRFLGKQSDSLEFM